MTSQALPPIAGREAELQELMRPDSPVTLPHTNLDLAQIRAAHLGATQALEGLIDELEKEVAEIQTRLRASNTI